MSDWVRPHLCNQASLFSYRALQQMAQPCTKHSHQQKWPAPLKPDHASNVQLYPLFAHLQAHLSAPDKNRTHPASGYRSSPRVASLLLVLPSSPRQARRLPPAVWPATTVGAQTHACLATIVNWSTWQDKLRLSASSSTASTSKFTLSIRAHGRFR